MSNYQDIGKFCQITGAKFMRVETCVKENRSFPNCVYYDDSKINASATLDLEQIAIVSISLNKLSDLVKFLSDDNYEAERARRFMYDIDPYFRELYDSMNTYFQLRRDYHYNK
jgi:hypothetical protein